MCRKRKNRLRNFCSKDCCKHPALLATAYPSQQWRAVVHDYNDVFVCAAYHAFVFLYLHGEETNRYAGQTFLHHIHNTQNIDERLASGSYRPPPIPIAGKAVRPVTGIPSGDAQRYRSLWSPAAVRRTVSRAVID